MSRKLNFTWDSYQEHSRVMLQKMMSSKFSDVTLVCEDRKKIPAHRNILSACSPVLRDILEDIDLSDLKHPIIYLKGIKYQEMKAILHFSYMGQVDVLSESVDDFLSSAKILEIEGLHTENDEIEQIKNSADDIKDREDNIGQYSIEEDIHEDSNKDSNETSNKNDSYFGFGSIPDDNLDQSKEKGKPKRGAKYNCKQCNRFYFAKRSLWFHRKSVHGGTQYSCDECDFVTERAMYLRNHMQTIHDMSMSYKIRFENYSTKASAPQQKEIDLKDQNTNTTSQANESVNDDQTNTSIPQKRKNKYKCNKCGFNSEIQSYLIKHMKTHLKKISFKNEENLPGKIKLNPKRDDLNK